MKLEWNKDKLLEILNQDELLLQKDNNAVVIEIITIRNMIGLPTLNEEIEKTDNLEKRETYKYVLNKSKELYNMEVDNEDINMPLCIAKMPTHSTLFDIKKKMTFEETIQIVRDLSSEKDREFFDKLLNEQRINVDKKKNGGITYYLDNSKECYINVGFNGTISDIRLLSHEFGHATQLKNINSIEESYNLFSNNFREAKAILNELLVLERNDYISKKDLAKDRNRFNTTYNFIIDTAYNDNIKTYYYSFMLAIYLFDLYKSDKAKYDEYLLMLDECILRNSEREILQKMNINSNNMFESYKRYLKTYSSR